MGIKKSVKKIETTEALAKHLGLSRWTISRALNGHKNIHSKTVKKFKEDSIELGFQPNKLAKTLRGGKSGLIGICFDELDSPILSTKVSALQKSLRAKGFHGIIELTQGDNQLRLNAVSHLIGMRVEAILFIASKMEPSNHCYSIIENQSIPILLIDPLVLVENVPTILLDRSKSLELSIQHLIDKGVETIACIGIDPYDNGYGTQRCSRLSSILKKCKLNQENVDFIYSHKPYSTHHTAEYGIQLAKDLLNKNPLPDGVIALNDRVAMGVIQYLRKKHLSIPKDLLIIGHDNQESSKFCYPELTSIDQNPDRMMEVASEMLVKILNHESPSKTTKIEPSLIPRTSTLLFNDE